MARDTSINTISWAKRAALADAPEAPAREYIFDVTADRKTTFAVSVFLPDEAVRDWAGGMDAH